MILPPPLGLVLAGGRSTRMGADKSLLDFHGEPQLPRTVHLLSGLCTRVLVAVRPDQARSSPYSAFELVFDPHDDLGPAAGLLAAWQCVPESALLALAVDLPLVDAPLLHLLLEARDGQAIATAFEHADGTLEPLCTVWEPAAEPILRAHARNFDVSLRRVLESSTVKRLKPPHPACIRSANTQAEAAELKGLVRE